MELQSFLRAPSRKGRAPATILPADLSIAIDNILVAAQFLQPARPAGVELVRADADFGAEAKLITVVEARAGVDHYCGGIDLAREAAGGFLIARHDRLRVLRAEARDVLDRLLETIYDFH